MQSDREVLWNELDRWDRQDLIGWIVQNAEETSTLNKWADDIRQTTDGYPEDEAQS